MAALRWSVIAAIVVGRPSAFGHNFESQCAGIVPYSLVEREHLYLGDQAAGLQCSRQMNGIQGSDWLLRERPPSPLYDLPIHRKHDPVFGGRVDLALSACGFCRRKIADRHGSVEDTVALHQAQVGREDQ